MNSIKYFYRYLKDYKLQLFVVLAGCFISMFVVVKMPEYIADAINYLALYIAGSADKGLFNQAVMIIAIFGLISYIFGAIQNLLMSKVSGDVTESMRTDLFKKIEGLPIRFFDQSNDGDILARFTSDLDNISNTLNQSIHQIMTNIVMLGITFFMMFQYDVELSLVALSTSPIVILVAYYIIKQSQKYVTKQQKRLGALNGFGDEHFSGQKLIISTGIQDLVKDEFKVYNDELYEATFKGQLYSNLLAPVLQGLQMLTTGIVIFYGVWMTSTGRLPLAQAAGTLFLYTQYVRMIYQPLSQIAAQYTQMQLAFTGASRILEVLNEEDELDRTTVVDIDGIAGDVVLDNVSFAYDEGHNVLKNIDITVEKGAMVALVGHTGSGKTTVMNLLNRFYDVHDGMIRFDGRDIRDISLKSLRKNVGIVLQDSILFTGTIRDNIAYGRRDANQEEVEDAAKRAHIHDFVMSLEDGYDTEVSEGNAKMSVGQKQLISIARTMLVNPDLLILDEATSNVDTVTEHQIQGAMDEITKGRTSFVIAHRLKTILEADKIIVLQQGEILEEGTHQELLNAKGHSAMLYENQFVFES